MLHTEDIYQIFSLCVWFCSEGCMELMLDLSHPSLQSQYLNLTCLPLSIPSNNLLGSITHSSIFPGPLAFRFLGYLVVNHYSFFFFFFKFIYLLFLAVLGLRLCARAFSSCGKRGPLFIAVCGPLTIAASLVAEHRLQTRRLSSCGSRA